MNTRIRWVVSAVATIWLAVLFVSVFGPHLITGSQQEHIPIAALVTWISGAAATRSVLNAMLRRQVIGMDQEQFLKGMTASVAAVWVVVAFVSIFVPPVLTGSDPTHLPIATILAPIAGAIVTGTVAQFVERMFPSEAASSTTTVIRCASCGKDNPSEARFCLQCGSSLAQANAEGFCPKCGAKAFAGSDYCAKCGSKLATT